MDLRLFTLQSLPCQVSSFQSFDIRGNKQWLKLLSWKAHRSGYNAWLKLALPHFVLVSYPPQCLLSCSYKLLYGKFVQLTSQLLSRKFIYPMLKKNYYWCFQRVFIGVKCTLHGHNGKSIILPFHWIIWSWIFQFYHVVWYFFVIYTLLRCSEINLLLGNYSSKLMMYYFIVKSTISRLINGKMAEALIS